jgi:hypothetical protein
MAKCPGMYRGPGANSGPADFSNGRSMLVLRSASLTFGL